MFVFLIVLSWEATCYLNYSYPYYDLLGGFYCIIKILNLLIYIYIYLGGSLVLNCLVSESVPSVNSCSWLAGVGPGVVFSCCRASTSRFVYCEMPFCSAWLLKKKKRVTVAFLPTSTSLDLYLLWAYALDCFCHMTGWLDICRNVQGYELFGGVWVAGRYVFTVVLFFFTVGQLTHHA